MNKKVAFNILLAVAIYGIFAASVVIFYDDSPEKMDWEDREAYNRQYIGRLSMQDASKEQIIQELGSPDITEAQRVDDVQYQIMFYRTQHVKSDGITTQDECTFLLFKDHNLVKIGKPTMETTLTSEIKSLTL